jgi:hypothetical protein
MRRLGAAAAAAALVLAAAAPLARATFHEMSIREVYPGSATSPESEYVELQMWAPGQNFVGGHSLRSYDDGSALLATTTFAADVTGDASQSTILLATPTAEAQFGVSADLAMAPNQLDPAGGAVCWEALDCVAWGNFKGSLPGPVGSPTTPGGIPDGMALRRTIAQGCATLLEPTDDRDNSAADFSPVFPSPRPNSVAPSERPCGTEGGEQSGSNGGPGGRGAPQTRLSGKRQARTRDRTPTFRFTTDERGASFQCKLDGKPFKACRSPFTSDRLRPGRHVFSVRARDDSGRFDPSPARYAFRVVSKRG